MITEHNQSSKDYQIAICDKISIVVPLFNAEKFIEQTIESVLTQSYDNFELILVNDCSTDNSLKIISEFSDDRIRVINNTDNLGAGETRNVGIRAATGEMIAFLDADDIWRDGKLDAQVRFMRDNNVAVSYTRYDIIDESGAVYASSGDIPSRANYHKLLRHCYMRTSSVMYDTRLTGGKVYCPDIRKRQDFVLFLRLLRRANEAILFNEITCSYRLHPGGISHNKFKNIRYQWDAYRKEEGLPLSYSMFLMANWFWRAGLVVSLRRWKRNSAWNLRA